MAPPVIETHTLTRSFGPHRGIIDVDVRVDYHATSAPGSQLAGNCLCGSAGGACGSPCPMEIADGAAPPAIAGKLALAAVIHAALVHHRGSGRRSIPGLPGGGPDEVLDRDAATDPNAVVGPAGRSPLNPSADRGDRQSGDRAGPGSRNGESAGDEHVVQR